MEHQPISGGTASKAQTKAVVELPKVKGSVTFVTSPDSDKEYIIKPYVKAWGRYYYGSGGDDRWVDLGLPSGILWAKYNIGATSPEENGGYYAWGETEEKDSYTIDNYKHAKFIGYDEWGTAIYQYQDIGDDISGTQYDVAHVKWGDGSRMPTLQDVKEIFDNCSFKFGHYDDTPGIYVIGLNGNSIFIPYAGVYSDLGFSGEVCAIYWSSLGIYEKWGYHARDYGAYAMRFDIDMLMSDFRDFANFAYGPCGLPVRPVKDKESIED